MTGFLSLLTITLLIYTIVCLITPQKALFFLKDQSKRKRWPWALIIFFAFIFCLYCVPDQHETSVAQEVKDIEAEIKYPDADPTELTPQIIAAYDSIQKSGENIYAMEDLKCPPNVGPNYENWRHAQWKAATLAWWKINYAETLYLKGEKSISDNSYRRAEESINEAMTSVNKDFHFSGYYKIGAIAELIERTHDKGVELKQRLRALPRK